MTTAVYNQGPDRLSTNAMASGTPVKPPAGLISSSLSAPSGAVPKNITPGGAQRGTEGTTSSTGGYSGSGAVASPSAAAGTYYSPGQANAASYTSENANATGYNATTGDAAQADTTTRVVQPDELAQHQLNSIISDNSPLLQRARQRAYAEAGSRGLINSSMAVGSGEDAVIRNAMPLALQDANTYGRTASENMAAQNTGSMFNAGQTNAMTTTNLGLINRADEVSTGRETDVSVNNASRTDAANAQNAALATNTSQFNAGQQSEASQFGANANLQTNLANLNSQTQLGIANLNSQTQQAIASLNSQTQQAIASADNATRVALQQMISQNSQVLGSNQNASQAFNTTMDLLARIQADPNLDPEAKRRISDNLIQTLNDNLNMLGRVSGLNLQSTLDFSPAPAAAPPPPGAAPAPSAGAGAGTPAGDTGQQADGSYVDGQGHRYPSYEAYRQAWLSGDNSGGGGAGG